ncbi:MAG TPA: glycosyltransferase family 4 protein [Pyrinomonadaceae bacterium]
MSVNFIEQTAASVPVEQALKVMILSLEYSPKLSGGVGTHVMEMSRGLGRAGHQVTVLTFTPGQAKTLSESNVQVHMISQSGAETEGTEGRSMVQSILDFNRDVVSYGRSLIADLGRRPDLINYHNWMTWPAARELGQMFGIPTLGTIHFLSEPTERWWGQTPDPEIVRQEDELFRKAERFIIVSQSMSDIVQAAHGVADERISVVYNGLDVEPFMNPLLKAEEVERLRRTVAADDEKIVLFAGRLSPQKGIDALLSSAAQVLAEYPNVVYLVVGEPDTREMVPVIDGLFQQFPALQDKVKMLGKMARPQLATLFQVANIVVIPSLYDTCPYMTVEAMAAGVPVVATRVGGLAEMVVDGETGLLVTVHPAEGRHRVDVDELASAQLRLLRDAGLARRMSSAGRRRVMSHYTLDKMVEETVRVYRRVVAEQNMPHRKLRRMARM